MRRDILFWSDPDTSTYLIDPFPARLMEIYFFSTVLQYIYHAHLKNLFYMGFVGYKTFMTRGFGHRFKTYKELFYSLPADCRVLFEEKAARRFEFERERIKVVYYGIAIPDAALAELSDYCRRAIYYDISPEYAPRLVCLKEYPFSRIDSNFFMYY